MRLSLLDNFVKWSKIEQILLVDKIFINDILTQKYFVSFENLRCIKEIVVN